ncbi:hypothetical protein M0811_11312 [Anaeramoeba ignava]|uniref:BTB domain-containing protein n=1 Tax=Anaeramoeba ignava TaxID=1746090 RepID=A0A9Q0R7H4_ANAIG|nr:hypothetical protein M0811_11312 [Anaeramoeba ignava]
MQESNLIFGAGMNDYGQLAITPKQNVHYFQKITKYDKEKVILIAAGYQNTLFVCESNKVYIHGLKETTFSSFFAEKPQIIQVKAGQDHFLILTEDGDVFGCFANSNGQIGQPSLNFINTPQKILIPHKVNSIYCSGQQSYFLLENGDLFGCGRNDSGLFPHSKPGNISTPEFITQSVERFFTGIYSSQYFFIRNGELFCSGNNSYGQLGLGHSNPISEITQISFFSGKDIIDISCGFCHTLVLVQEGESQKLYTTGYFDYNGLATPSNLTSFEILKEYSEPKIIQMGSGSQFSVILLESNKFLIFGYNDWGQLSTGDTSYVRQAREITFPEIKSDMQVEVICGSYLTFIKTRSEDFYQYRKILQGYNLKNALLQIFKNKTFCDIEIVSTDGYSINFHSLIAILRSQKPLPILIKNFEESSRDEINTFLTFLYSGIVGNTHSLKKMFQKLQIRRFNLKKNQEEIFYKDIAWLFSKQQSKDFTIICQNEKILVHKIILFSRSPFFLSLFENSLYSSFKSYEIQKGSPISLNHLISFLYSDTFDENIPENIINEIQYLATLFEIESDSLKKLTSKISDEK